MTFSSSDVHVDIFTIIAQHRTKKVGLFSVAQDPSVIKRFYGLKSPLDVQDDNRSIMQL